MCIIEGAIANNGNGLMSEREFSIGKRKRQSHNSDFEDEDIYQVNTHITEERYRSMLGEHIQRYKRRSKDSSTNLAPTRTGIQLPKTNLGSKSRKLGNGKQGGLLEIESTSEWVNDSNPRKQGNYREEDFAPQNGIDRFVIFSCCHMKLKSFGFQIVFVVLIFV